VYGVNVVDADGESVYNSVTMAGIVACEAYLDKLKTQVRNALTARRGEGNT
jgi:hypothetical protein